MIGNDDAHDRVTDLLVEALHKADAEGIAHEQALLALADMVSSFAWKLGGDVKVRALVTRIEAARDVLSGKRLPLPSETKN